MNKLTINKRKISSIFFLNSPHHQNTDDTQKTEYFDVQNLVSKLGMLNIHIPA